ncbi:MAG: hypothetical protein SPJ13_04650 [Bacteroidales bacterium]|nr:hypothetical protein [Bacteroidales bacterium]
MAVKRDTPMEMEACVKKKATNTERAEYRLNEELLTLLKRKTGVV